jgi:AmmeMemoRadiSam system protein A
LQKTLGSFELVPIVFGDVDAESAARALAPHVDETTLVVVSSDLSHYHPYAKARARDTECVQAICDMDLRKMKAMEACGQTPILTLMSLARLKGWSPSLLDYRNSGDTAGDKRQVVGYAALAFHDAGSEGQTRGRSLYGLEERDLLLKLARRTLEESVRENRLPQVTATEFPPLLQETRACFVTLTKADTLRGCIGHIYPMEPLYEAVMHNARNAALRDPRFSPVTADELDEIRIELSVLTAPTPLEFGSPEELLAGLEPRRDGVVLNIDGSRATYLPQVWEQLPEKIAFLDSLARKAGAGAADWRKPGVTVSTYRVEAFHEPGP